MIWQWLLVGRSRAARAIALIAGVAVALYLHNVHDVSNYFAFPIGIVVYLVLPPLWAILTRRSEI